MMEEEYVDAQDSVMSEVRNVDCTDLNESSKDFADIVGFDEVYDDEEGGNSFRGGRGRGNFRGRGRGPPPGWMNGPPPMRFRGRGYGPGGPPMRGRGFFRGRGGPRGFGPNNGPNFDGNWGPMGPPPPGMMGGPPPFGPPPMMGPGGPMGPPPNMMQPPPFGGPPGMPPPNMPAPELWVETKSEEGKSYYYHSRTRETTWTRPQESPNCKVITQADMEAMAASGQMPGMGGPPQSMPMNGPMGPPMGGPPMGGPPMGMMGGMMPGPGGVMPQGPVPPFMNQPPPWIKDGKLDQQQPDSTNEVDNDEMPPGETAPASQPNNGNMMGFPGQPSQPTPIGVPTSIGGPAPISGPPIGGLPPIGGPSISGPPPMGGPPIGGPPPIGAPPGGPMSGPPPLVGGPPVSGAPGWGGWGGWPPMVGQPPPGMAAGPNSGAPPQIPVTSTPSTIPGGPVMVESAMTILEPVALSKRDEMVISPDLIARASEWTAHRAPDGRPYYYHAGKQESVWEKPKPMKELEELQAKITVEKGEKPERKIEKIEIDDSKMEVIDVEAHAAHAEAAAAAEAERRAADERERQQRERQEKERIEKEKQEKERLEKEKAKQDRSRPISVTPISGTPWCVVWTGDGQVFFYNPTAHSSVWKRPQQLIGRADVDKAVSQPPDALLELQRKEAAANATTKAANGELKRSADSDSDESDTEPAKKVKPEEAAPKKIANSTAIDAGKEAAIDAEVRAARERAVVPLEQRVRSFRQMLCERDVSAFSTWEKELHKIVFDTRYLLLTSKERKQVFEKYVRERAEEERKEKKNRLQQKKTAFMQLLEEVKLHSKSSFTDFSSKHSRDERFKGIEKPRDRETFFNEHIADARKREKEEKERKRDQVKTEFIALLKEKGVDRHARWADAKKKVDSDPRYKAVESSTLREDYFREYCKIMKEERKKDKDGKEKERDRSSSKKEKKDKERDKDKEREKEKKDKKKDKGEPEKTVEVEAVHDIKMDDGAAKDREARAQASIKEREREVQRALATSLRDRDKEREYHKRDEAVQHFNALLADLVRNPDLSWREAKKQLKKDHRYSLAELLSKDDKERLFTQHTNLLASRRRDKLRTMLTELNVPPTAHWRDVKPLLANAPAYTSLDKMEREFRDFQRDRQSAAKTALRQLLQETRSITHKSLAAVKESQNAMVQIQDSLKHDARYLALEHIPDERQQIIMSYLEELEKKGPPPPPTATEPTRRANK